MNKIFNLVACLLFFFITIEAQQIQLVVRYDDFVLKSDSLNEGVIRVFQKHQIPLVLGVIPCDSNEKIIREEGYSFMSVIKHGLKNQSVEIALHGLNHSKVSNGEFGNVAITEQYRRLYKGKAVLDSLFDTSVITFIPPWNAYDVGTLSVMEKIGMKAISSSLTINQPFCNPTINYYPHTVGNFRSLLVELEKNKTRDGVVVLMFHGYDFDESFTLDSLDQILNKVSQLSYVKSTTFKGLIATHCVSNAVRISSNMEINLLTKYLKTNSMIQTTVYAISVRILNALIYLLVSLFCMILYAKLFRLEFTKNYLIFILSLICIGVSVWFHLFSPMELAVFVVCFPLLVIGAIKFLKCHFKT